MAAPRCEWLTEGRREIPQQSKFSAKPVHQYLDPADMPSRRYRPQFQLKRKRKKDAMTGRELRPPPAGRAAGVLEEEAAVGARASLLCISPKPPPRAAACALLS
jgi:hypothetical protein